MTQLAAPELTRYAEDGYVVRPGALDGAELTAATTAVEELIGDLERRCRPNPRSRGSYALQWEPALGTSLKWSDEGGGLTGLEPFCHLSRALSRLSEHPALAGTASHLLGVDAVTLYTEKVNLKPARIGNEITLHHDHAYWSDCCENTDDVVTAMLLLDDADRVNGCLQVLPGSHVGEPLPMRDDTGDGMSSCELDDRGFDWSRMVPLEMTAGSVVFFGSHLVHASAPNGSDRDRRALLFSYQPAGRRRLTELMDPSWYG